MANFNQNDRNKGGYFDQYVNFDQFLMQNNINSWSPLRNPPSGFGLTPQQASNPYNNSPFHFQSDQNNAFQIQQNADSNAGAGFGSSNWTQNSNLTVTASEFIPQQPSCIANSSTLVATANEFVPRMQPFGLDKQSKELPTNESKQSNTALTLCDMDKNDKIATKVTGENTSKTNFVIEALNNTHISDGGKSSATKTLNTTGGAIKKIRSQDYRNDSRDRHSNGEFDFPFFHRWFIKSC